MWGRAVLLAGFAAGGCLPAQGVVNGAALLSARSEHTATTFDPPPADFRPHPQTTVSEPIDRAPAARPFDGVAALAALHAVSLDGCGAHARVHAKVTFVSTGQVSDVVMDEVPAEARACLVERIRGARVEAFTGASIAVPVSYVVR